MVSVENYLYGLV